MLETITLIVALICLALMLWLLRQLNRRQDEALLPALEEKHRAMLLDLNDGLNKLGDRLNAASNESGERLRAAVALELAQTRETVLEKLHITLAEQGKAEQELI